MFSQLLWGNTDTTGHKICRVAAGPDLKADAQDGAQETLGENQRMYKVAY